MKLTVHDYSARASHWLAEGNAASERGNKAKAEKCYDKAQYWLILTQQEAEEWATKLLSQASLTPLALSYALMAAYARGQMNPKPDK